MFKTLFGAAAALTMLAAVPADARHHDNHRDRGNHHAYGHDRNHGHWKGNHHRGRYFHHGRYYQTRVRHHNRWVYR